MLILLRSGACILLGVAWLVVIEHLLLLIRPFGYAETRRESLVVAAPAWGLSLALSSYSAQKPSLTCTGGCELRIPRRANAAFRTSNSDQSSCRVLFQSATARSGASGSLTVRASAASRPCASRVT